MTVTFYIVGVSASIDHNDTYLILAHFGQLRHLIEMKRKFKFVSDLDAATIQ